MNTVHITCCIAAILLLTTSDNTIHGKNQTPDLVIIIVVDQLSYNALQKYQKYFKYGLRTLVSRGINYTNAHQPHATPETATGHATLSTGTYPKDHGIIANKWLNTAGNIVHASEDSKDTAAVLSPTGTYDFGVSSRSLMVDTLSDQWCLQSTVLSPRFAYALSLKDRAAVQMAGKLGKALWFDNKTGIITSSKAYFEQLPTWVTTFNTEQALSTQHSVAWPLARSEKSGAYQYVRTQLPDSTNIQKHMAGTTIPIDWHAHPENPLQLFTKTPCAQKLILQLAHSCVKEHMTCNSNQKLLLWISLSPLDKAGHTFGPDSLETIDMLLHLDKQLKSFMKNIRRIVSQKKILFVLTADHGVSPMPETVAAAGIPARRYNSRDLVKDINTHIFNTLNARSIIRTYRTPYFYLDSSVFNSFNDTKQQQIINQIKSFLHKKEGVKQVWTYSELEKQTLEPHTIEDNFKQQLYSGRSGQLIIQMSPYYEITDYETGADHSSPYNYNTHVPLILYHHGSLELKTIQQPVYTTQLASTLAYIMQIPTPSASTAAPLPGVGELPRDILF